MILRKYLPVIGIFFFQTIFAQSFLNLDFEETNSNNLPLKWDFKKGGYSYQVDNSTKFSGKKSMQITSRSADSSNFSSIYTLLPVHLLKGKELHLTAKIKIQSHRAGNAGLWIKVTDAKKAIISFDNMKNKRIKGTTDWKEVSLSMRISPDAEKIVVGGLFEGEGIVWFDDFRIASDHQPIQDASKKEKLNQEEITLLKKYIYPLKTYDPDTNNTQDLEILNKLIGDSKILALGESTHGSSEIFKMKDRIIRYLIQNNNFNIFSIEARMPESYQVSNYTTKGEGSAKDYLRAMGFWTWNTHEVLAMTEWMKKYNETSSRKILFTGFDMQDFYTPLNELKKVFKANPSILEKLDKLSPLLANFKDKEKRDRIVEMEKKDIVVSIITDIKNDINKEKIGNDNLVWINQYLRLLEQNTELNSFTRDKFMAENVLWIKNHNQNSKIILWAHNTHINKAPIRMGKYLSDQLGKDYTTIGFAFHSGQYTAVGEDGLTAYNAQEPYVGTYEYFLNSINEPYFILDIKKIKKDNNEKLKWLIEGLDLRITGSRNKPDEFSPKNISKDFDYLIFINKSTASVLLK
ncbi:erythromycin esterase family protein [Chryseobacterium jejuense]|uniref:Erythromycin esterase n=1 Tax=Chryseobacterium jejuense TaxID=445960 RepID=A0A2X2VIB8_CHRJE|nr:erythromycin esterase family protein [Chryseobacterium jejuense]SDJ70499.1 erythromycin esterase [Chryseobacterium jejuense]SQB26517.1 Erythromycin esterase [Chryseobacterium jejuense]